MMFFPNDSGTDWGNLGTLYMEIYRDMDTGEVLEQPVVRIITISGEIATAPTINFKLTNNGRAAFSWNSVEGATDYVICKIRYEKDEESALRGLRGYAMPIAMTSDTYWTEDAPEYSLYSTINMQFKCSDDVDYRYCVIAINSEGTSMMSNTFAQEEMAANLVFGIADYDNREEWLRLSEVNAVSEAPIYGYVDMCDGNVAEKLIDYDTKNATINKERWATTDDKGNLIGISEVNVLTIPYVFEGTPFAYELSIPYYDEENMKSDMEFLEKREEDLRKKGGNTNAFANRMEQKEAVNVPEELRDITGLEITANSALSEYIAVNMLAGEEFINLRGFKEAASDELLCDALFEAYYQNPLILGIQGYAVSADHTVLRIKYDDVDVLYEKQQEILNVIPEIINEIITEGMTDVEKEFAINKYLCDTITYDDAACENAMKNDYRSVDAIYNDSFTAYGALVKGKCVCAGYAAAFKLLAKETGLDSIVVTGLLSGSGNHAWNKVQINGKWQIVDVTNNGIESLGNALLNLSNEIGNNVLIEDKEYIIDKHIDKYVAETDENEFYRVNERYYSYEEIVNQLTEALGTNKSVTLRTEYELDDYAFYTIAEMVQDYIGEGKELYGCYWLGVIYLEVEE